MGEQIEPDRKEKLFVGRSPGNAMLLKEHWLLFEVSQRVGLKVEGNGRSRTFWCTFAGWEKALGDVVRPGRAWRDTRYACSGRQLGKRLDHS